jgi:hypothetical protein
MEEILHNVDRLIKDDQRSFAGIFPYDQPSGTFKVLSGGGTGLSLEVLKRAVEMSKVAKADDGHSVNVMEHVILPRVTQCVKSCKDDYTTCGASPGSDARTCDAQQMSCSKECILNEQQHQ